MNVSARDPLAFVVLGCAKNQVEAETLASRLAQDGWKTTSDLSKASTVVVHTCGFLESARDEALGAVARIRKTAPRAFLVLSGCFAQYLNGKRPQGVDALLGTGQLDRLPALLSAGVQKRTVCSSPGGLHDASRPRPLRQGQLSAYVRVSEGCDRRCSFCIIPQLRGAQKSRDPRDIEREVRGLLARGVREISLVSQETTAYGRDVSPSSDLPALLGRLLRLPDLRWLRLLYTHPAGITGPLVRLLAEEEKLCGYLDMPLQHVSERMLRLMRRDYDQKSTMRLLERLRKEVPHLTLRTTFIVGFPGETERDFRQMRDVVAAGTFDHAGFFAYSPEPRSPSARFPGRLPEEEMRERMDRILEAQTQVMRRKNESRIGQGVEALVETGPDGRWQARGLHQAPEVDGGIRLARWPMRSGFYNVRLTGTAGIDLTGRLAGDLRPRCQPVRSRSCVEERSAVPA
ncbi:MAG TPA: 30S ribosomal protein S12 methylthiotransferase RimO [Elusimicrobiota bacterium]|nr:30S ribosomal protein S12 methylthiotransferase RimO [Elusimicrobiota bacterium]